MSDTMASHFNIISKLNIIISKYCKNAILLAIKSNKHLNIKIYYNNIINICIYYIWIYITDNHIVKTIINMLFNYYWQYWQKESSMIITIINCVDLISGNIILYYLNTYN